MVKKTIEETYQKLTQREHVLLRSGMYIGSVKKQCEELWVPDPETFMMKKKIVEYSPGFMKIFDEVLTNATDHSFRHPEVTQIKINYSQETGELSVWNNGPGIPVVEHQEHKMYVPELIFGHLLSGSNYDDSDSRTGSGTNGLGSKLTNIYSKKFIIETVDSNTGKKFIQEHSENMTVKSKAKITSNSKSSYTKITFIPDYKRFDMENLEDDTVALINKRAIDCIACTASTVKIYLNGELLKGKGMTDYTKYYFDTSKVYSESFNERVKNKKGEFVEYIWEYTIVPSEHYEQVSFVNGNATLQGGKHVDYIMYQIINKLKVMLETKKKLVELKPNFIKDKLFLFLRATVANPVFNSQTKEQLTTASKDFGCVVQVSDKFIERLYKSSITEEIVEFCKAKESIALAKTTDGSKKNRIFIPKLEDAIKAGTNQSNKCSLILTEGLSALTFALHGRSVIGTDYIGAFPLRGKALNVRDATIQQLTSNEEICNIKQILGLKEGKVYKNTDELRYGKVILLTDSDVDGSHIKALLVNFISFGWPSLLKLNPSFVQTIKTPILKAVKGKQIMEFFTEQDYHKWVNSGININSYKIKYFKGLGSSSKDDAKDIFKRINDLRVDYYYKDEKCEESILLAFDKDKNSVKLKKKEDTETNDGSEIQELVKCSDRRKEWLSNYDRDSYIDMKQTKISFQELINKELIHFSIYDNSRSIPSLCDGLKPSQRKILHYMLKKNITDVIKVAQLSGYVSAECGYHHGEVSLQGAIIGMAQDYTGSNNINLLYPDGNFGTAYLQGKDSASPRYIFTKLSDITSLIFNKLDLPLLNYLNDDGLSIEPDFFIPIIPMILVNGCSGIGTGYSTFIPPFNPKNIIENLLRVLNDDLDPLPMKPWYRGFNGDIKDEGQGKYISKGKYTKISDTQLKITELPVGMGVTTYKEYLESLIENNMSIKKGDKKATKSKVRKVVLKDVQNKTADENNAICFIIEFKEAKNLTDLIKSETLEKELKLTKSFSTNNMYLFNQNMILTKYQTANDILLDFYDLRLDYYQLRKEYLEKKLKEELVILKAKMKFIKQYIDKELDINRKSKQFIVDLLKTKKYPLHEESYDYLLNLQVYAFTLEKIELLNTQCEKKQAELEFIQSKSNADLWAADLIQLKEKLNI